MKATMHSLVTACLVSLGVLFSQVSLAQSANNSQASNAGIALAPLEQQALRLTHLPERIAISNPEVLDATLLSSASGAGPNILLTGLKAGSSDLHIWFEGNSQPKHWKITVHSGLEQALQQQQAAPEANIDVIADEALISGHSESLINHQTAHQVAASSVSSPDNIVDLSTVGTTGMVQVEVKIAELSSTVLKEIGIDWTGGKNGGNWNFGSPSNIISNGFSIAFNGSKHFGARLNLLERNGLARVLAEPTLVALSGQSASFLSGGSIPVPTAGGLGTQNVEYKDFGIGLTVSPTILANNRIALKVAPESSELDYGNAMQAGDSLIPALTVRKTDTFVELGDGESFIISGLVSRKTMANVDKMPVLGQLPIIGAFFRNMQYSQQENELVIIVTPRLVRPINAQTTIPLPGEGRDLDNSSTNAWGAYIMGPVIGQSHPGFSH